MSDRFEDSNGSTRPGTATCVREFCLEVLERGDLASKLAPPRTPAGDWLPDDAPHAPIHVDAPGRDPGLEMTTGVGRLPKPGELARAEARATCLARFAHHELMAVELFAWALLRWPDAPAGLRAGFLRALADEQRHCRFYLARLEAHDSRLEAHALPDYFWKQAPAIAASPHGVRAYLAAMGLTLEQANLDFTLTYRDAFREAGDEASARVCQVVHDDEIGHVALAAQWMPRTAGHVGGPTADATHAPTPAAEVFDDIDAYTTCVPFPLGPARAKGRRFEPTARRRAGLSERFIDFVRHAKSPQQQRGEQRTSHEPD
jgi:uncharacterized ferritin-like protein (DUF455 family)